MLLVDITPLLPSEVMDQYMESLDAALSKHVLPLYEWLDGRYLM